MRTGLFPLPLAAAAILVLGLAACGEPKRRTTPIPERPGPQSVINCPPGQNCDGATPTGEAELASSTEEAIEDASTARARPAVASRTRTAVSRRAVRIRSHSARSARCHCRKTNVRYERTSHRRHVAKASRRWRHKHQHGGHYGYLDNGRAGGRYAASIYSSESSSGSFRRYGGDSWGHDARGGRYGHGERHYAHRQHSEGSGGGCRVAGRDREGFLCWPGKVPMAAREDDSEG